MACPDCYSNSPLIFDIQSFVNSSCSDCIQQNCLPVKYLCYTGPDLPCSGIETGDTLEVALEKLDTQVCSALGDYSTYQFNCLPAWLGDTITTEAEFVDAITAYACEIAENLLTVTSVTIPALEASVAGDIAAVSEPAITCAAAGVTSGDDLNTILAKYCIKFGELDTAIDITGVSWSNCLASSTPATIDEAFQLVEDQICEVYALASAAAVLPTFNNSANCLAGGVADTLVETIDAIITYTCSIFDVGAINWYCLDDNAATDLQGAFQALVIATNENLEQAITEVSADFVLELVNPLDPCEGMSLSLATPLVNNDRLVASDPADLNPGTLEDKILAGDNISLAIVGEQLEITAENDHLLLAGPGDATPGLLIDKVAGSTDMGVTLTPSYNGVDELVDFTLDVNMETLATNLLIQIIGNPVLLAQFCEMVTTCTTGGCDSTLYSVENTSGSDQYIFWLTCGSAGYLNVLVPTATTVELCALTDSIVPVTGVTVTSLGACAALTPSTTTTTTTTTTVAP